MSNYYLRLGDQQSMNICSLMALIPCRNLGCKYKYKDIKSKYKDLKRIESRLRVLALCPTSTDESLKRQHPFLCIFGVLQCVMRRTIHTRGPNTNSHT